jgi:hypothetical protein
MKTPGALVLLLVLLGGVVLATPQQPFRPRPQPLFGLGALPPPGTASEPFFDDTVLHDLRLTINSKDWAALKENYLSNDYYPCDFRWRDQVVRNVGIRSRGTGSRSGVKPGLRVDFDRYTSNQQFLGLKSFVLRNNTQDETNLHERLSMLMFRRMGAHAPREAHTRLYVNEEYVGLFSIVESIDKAFLRRTLGEDAGHLFEYDYPPDAAPYYFEDRGSDSSRYVPLPFKPETHEDDPRPEFIVQWVQAANQSSDATFLAQVGEYIDFDQLLRHVAVEVFMGDYDGFIGNWGMNNFYAYRLEGRPRFVLFPWDKSEALKAEPTSSIFHNLVDVIEAQRNRLVARALAFPELYGRYLDIMQAIARSAAEPLADDPRGWLERELDREYLQIREAALTDPQKPFSNDAFESAIAGVREFVRRRPGEVISQVAAARR